MRQAYLECAGWKPWDKAAAAPFRVGAQIGQEFQMIPRRSQVNF